MDKASRKSTADAGSKQVSRVPVTSNRKTETASETGGDRSMREVRSRERRGETLSRALPRGKGTGELR